MVALHRADVYSHQPVSPAGQYVQPVDGWTIRRETLWVGKVCSVLDIDWYCGSGGELFDGASGTWDRTFRTLYLQKFGHAFGGRFRGAIWTRWSSIHIRHQVSP